jgi:hypothetical protein
MGVVAEMEQHMEPAEEAAGQLLVVVVVLPDPAARGTF